MGQKQGKLWGSKIYPDCPINQLILFLYKSTTSIKHTQFESEVRIAIVALAILTGYVALCHAAAATADTPHPEVVLTRDNS